MPFNRSYWVVPSKLLAGSYPGSENKDETHLKLKALLDHGIRHVIDLMEPGELNWNEKGIKPYAPQMKHLAEAAGIEVTFDRMAIKDSLHYQRICLLSGRPWIFHKKM